MSQRRQRLYPAVCRNATMAGVASAFFLAGVTGACTSKLANCFDIQPGNRIAITVNGLPSAPFSSDECGFGFDMTQGLTLVAVDLGNPDTSSASDSSCNAAAVAIEPFADWTWTATSWLQPGSAPTVLSGDFNASNGTCTGTTQIEIVAEDGQPFAAADAGQGPVVMQRLFIAQGDGGAGCPSRCSDAYLVTLRRL